ncbi:MAG TPA: hypothetical protein VMM18_06950 [Gemmatimonadaceae bacterium]|nr:hypothetical protein [Gemmatimonadaceae bacterium]
MIELLISVLVLSIGLLALTGASAVILRQITGGAQLGIAATVAQGRLERLRGEDCRLIAGGTSTERGITESWTVLRTAGRVEVVDSVSLRTRAGSRSWTFRSIISCPEIPR